MSITKLAAKVETAREKLAAAQEDYATALSALVEAARAEGVDLGPNGGARPKRRSVPRAHRRGSLADALLAALPGQLTDLARKAGTSPNSARNTLARLAERGVVVKGEDGVWSAAPAEAKPEVEPEGAAA